MTVGQRGGDHEHPARPRVAVGPRPAAFAHRAIEAGGGVVCAPNEAECLVWIDEGAVDELGAVLASSPGIDWVQLPFAGIEKVAAAGLLGDGRTWTCAKGAYSEPVAEHALALALAGLRRFDVRVGARSWGRPEGLSLYDEDVTIVGGGGITEALLSLLVPLRVRVTVVRRSSEELPGAARTLQVADLADALPAARVVFLALALTPDTRGIIAAPELSLMRSDSWLVNVARGGHIVTDDLVEALSSGGLGGAALDVTDPEPLPDGHPLWSAPRTIITPHTADTWEMVRPRLAERIRTNVDRRSKGMPLVGLVDASAGY